MGSIEHQPGTSRADEQRELLQFLKVGQCVNGVTHDVNNCLGAILAYAELAQMDRTLGPEPRRMVGRIMEAVDRASALVTELTNVARPLKASQGIIDLRELVKGIVLLRDYDLRLRQVEVTQEFPADVPSLSGDVARVRLALLYLLLYAEEAATGADAKRIRISLTQRGTEGLELAFWTPAAVAEQDRARIFDPGFLSAGGQQTGLSLYSARAVITAHGGTLEYVPERGLVVYLPFLHPRQ